MCGRYTLNKQADDLAKRFNLASVPKSVKPNFNVAPAQVMPVVTEPVSGERQLELMHWGIHRNIGPDVVKELINTRADKAFGGFWKRTVLNRRCLIPATGFYEWKSSKDGKHPFFIHPKNTEIFSFAGIWDDWESKNGHKIKTYSIITTEPNKEMRAIHDRMPVILRIEDEEAWLEPSNDEPPELEPLLSPFHDGGLEIFEVSKDVNNPLNNSSRLILPVASH